MRDELAPRFEEQGLTVFRDPWDARDQYISVVLDRTRESGDRFWRGTVPIDFLSRSR